MGLLPCSNQSLGRLVSKTTSTDDTPVSGLTEARTTSRTHAWEDMRRIARCTALEIRVLVNSD